MGKKRSSEPQLDPAATVVSQDASKGSQSPPPIPSGDSDIPSPEVSEALIQAILSTDSDREEIRELAELIERERNLARSIDPVLSKSVDNYPLGFGSLLSGFQGELAIEMMDAAASLKEAEQPEPSLVVEALDKLIWFRECVHLYGLTGPVGDVLRGLSLLGPVRVILGRAESLADELGTDYAPFIRACMTDTPEMVSELTIGRKQLIVALKKTIPDEKGGPEHADQLSRFPKLKAHDLQAWQLTFLSGMTQANVATALNKMYGTNYKQGQVSRMIARAQAHARANGVADMLSKPIGQPRTADPSRLELGPRVDKRKPRPSDMTGA
ncbi:MAG: hypothetical protein WC718_13415 [Phycisphaerales bacterium]|jgi:hypothetical protein